MPHSKGGKSKRVTSYIPGAAPTTADPRVKAPKSKTHTKGDCPASTLNHKHQRAHVGQREPQEKWTSESPDSIEPIPEKLPLARDPISSDKAVLLRKSRPLQWKSVRKSKALLCEIDFHLPGVPHRPGSGHFNSKPDLGCSTESLPLDSEIYEASNALDAVYPLSGNVWKFCQEGPDNTHVLDIPVASWPDLSPPVPSTPLVEYSGCEAHQLAPSCSTPALTIAVTSPASPMSICSDADSIVSDWDVLDVAIFSGSCLLGNTMAADVVDEAWVRLDDPQSEADGWTLVA
eukprot:jgi/Botrbrau1/20294/Bobra.31_1s0072.1